MIYVITGRRELGKTTLARYLAHKRTPQFVIDPRAQWPMIEGDQAPIVTDVADWRILAHLEAGFSVVLQPRNLDDAIATAAEIAEAYVSRDRGRELSLVLDESKLYEKYLASFGWVMRCCDRQRVNVILTAHRPQDVSTDVRAILDTWCIFRTTQAHDLQAIAERTSDRTALLASQLEPRHFVAWDDAAVEKNLSIHKRPELWREPDNLELVGEPLPAAPASSNRRLWE